MSKASERKARKHASGKVSFFLLFIGGEIKDHVLKARYIKIQLYKSWRSQTLQFYWMFAAFLYISKLRNNL